MMILSSQGGRNATNTVAYRANLSKLAQLRMPQSVRPTLRDYQTNARRHP